MPSFAGTRDSLLRLAAGLCLAVLAFGPALGAADAPQLQLQEATRQAFARYVRRADLRNNAELARGTNLLWIDALPTERREEAYAALKRGEAKLEKLDAPDGGTPIRCPNGMIHHWVGLLFVPGAKLDDVLYILEDYNRHSLYFAPDVERSRIEAREDDHFRVFLRFRRRKIITVVLNTEHDVRYFRDGATGAHSRSSAVRIAEVQNAGRRDESESPPGDDDGFLWGMDTWWRMQERDGGVYLQSEVVSLTRDIPTGLAWMIGPFLSSVPRETLSATLNAARKAVEVRVSAKR